MAMTFEPSTIRSQAYPAPRFTTNTYQPQRDTTEQSMQRRVVIAGWRIKPVALVLAAAIVAVAVIGFGSDAAASGTEAGNADSIEIYVVQPGDTLWEIATEMAEPGEDVRRLVDSLEEIAGGSQLDVGQRLIIDHMLIRK